MRDKREYKSIIKILRALQARIALMDSLRGIIISVGAAILLFGLLIGVTLVTWPDSAARTIIDLGVILAMAFLIYLTVIRYLVRLHPADVVERTGQAGGGIGEHPARGFKP